MHLLVLSSFLRCLHSLTRGPFFHLQNQQQWLEFFSHHQPCPWLSSAQSSPIKDLCDYTEPTWITQDTPILLNLLICNCNPPLQCSPTFTGSEHLDKAVEGQLFCPPHLPQRKLQGGLPLLRPSALQDPNDSRNDELSTTIGD